MSYRRIRKRSTGEWLAFVYGYVSDGNGVVSAAQHIADCAAGWGIPAADLEAVEAVGDPPDVSAGLAPIPPPPDPIAESAKRLKAWVLNPADPPVTRAVVLDILRILRRVASEL